MDHHSPKKQLTDGQKLSRLLVLTTWYWDTKLIQNRLKRGDVVL